VRTRNGARRYFLKGRKEGVYRPEKKGEKGVKIGPREGGVTLEKEGSLGWVGGLGGSSQHEGKRFSKKAAHDSLTVGVTT